MSLRRLSSLVLLVSILAVSSGRASTIAVSYLQLASDRFQKTIDVYTVSDAAGNHFAARGEFDNSNGNGPGLVPAMDEISANAPCPEITCITATFDPRQFQWGGWYFMNGVLGPADRQPAPNWGLIPNAGFGTIPGAVTGLQGASALRFKVRGKVGGENILFFCCGVGYDPDAGRQTSPFPDSSRRVSLAVRATTDWVQRTIDLTNVDLSYLLGGFGWVASADGNLPNAGPITFYLSDIQFVKERPNDPRLLVSYETLKSALSFDAVQRNAAYIYDNAVAIIALIAAGDIQRARAIGDALIYAQNHDRFFNGSVGPADGRLRNAYQGGDIALPAGWVPNNQPYTARMSGWYDPGHSTWSEDVTQVSTSTGNIAWAGLAFINLYETTRDQTYLTAAKKLGQWLRAYASDNPSRGNGGFTGGYEGWESKAAAAGNQVCASGEIENGQCKRLYKSTEHNIDLYSFFSRLYLADPAGASDWAAAAQQAKHFFLSQWDSSEGKFWTGTGEDGATTSKDVIPVDIQAWSILALGVEAQPYQDAALAFVESHHKISSGYGFKQNGGNGACGDHSWFEGTSQVADAYYQIGKSDKWQSVLAGVHAAQLPSGAVPATDGDCLNTGFLLNDNSPWLYYPRAHVGATAWLAVAESGVNPYRADLYSPSLSSSTMTFPDQAVGLSSGLQTVTLLNPGPSTLSIESITLAGANPADFIQTNSCGRSVQAGGRCVVSVAFTPAVPGTREGSLVIMERSDPLMVQPVAFTVSLSGNGVSPTASTFRLAVQVSPAGAGTVSVTPEATAGSYPAGTRVCLSASAASGWLFQGWSGATVDYTGCLVMDSDKSVTVMFAAVGASPSIQVTSLSPFGTLPGSVAGVVKGADPSKYQIALLIFLTGQGWFSKPYCSSTTVGLAQDGSFSSVFTTGGVDQYATQIALLLVPTSVSVPCYTSASGVPADLLQQSITQIIINRPNPSEREIQFAGQPWAVKASSVPIGPGGCIFSDTSDNVFVDVQGNLHLKITHTAGAWSCAEIYSRAAVGYGIYSWTITGFPSLDPTAVFGAFTWADAQSQARELDTEVGFNRPGDPSNAQFAVQPAGQAGNLQRITLPNSGAITFKMTWLPGMLSFQAFLGSDDSGKQLAAWAYPGVVPSADQSYENFRFNLWLNGGPPSTGQPQEAVISKFQYQPFVADATVPTIDSAVNGADFLPGSAPGGILSVMGRNLAAQSDSASTRPLPTAFDDIVVTINGLPAPLFYVSPNQINVQVPYITPVGASQVAVTVHGRSSQLFAVKIGLAAPGIFTSPSQNCLAQNQDNTLNAPNNPAAADSDITVYLAGIGQVDNPVPTGAAAPLSPLSRPILSGTAQLGGQAATLGFLGLVPDLIGVAQANIHIPAGLGSGQQSLLINVGGVSSNSCPISIANLNGGSVAVATTSLPAGNVGIIYSQTLVAIGGKPPYRNWKRTAGVIPPGLTLDASSGTISGTPTTATGSPFSFSVTVDDGAGATSAPQNLTISIGAGSAALSVSPPSLSFNYTQHGNAPAGTFLSVTSTPNNGVPFTTSLGSSGCSWLNFNAGSGTTPANSIPASLNTAVADGLSVGVYNCTITITAANASNSPIAVPVQLTLTAQSISVSPSSVTFNYPVPVPNPGTAPITVSSAAGSLPVTASLGSGCNWLNLVSGNGNTPYSVSLNLTTTVAATLGSGSYTCAVTFTATGTTLTTTLQVTLVVAAPATLSVSPSSLSFNYTQHGSAPAGTFLSVTSSPNSGVPFTTSLGSSGCSWLNFSAGNGTTPANSIPATLNTAVADGLSAGVYNCTITITSTNAANSPVTVPVKLTLTAQSISVSPSSITFNYPIPVPNPGTAPITVSSAAGSLPVTTSLGSGCNWLNLASGNGNTPYSVSLNLNTTVAATLAAGSYTCTITFSATGTTLTTTLQVTLVVAAPATLSPSPSSLSFNYTQHGNAPAGTFLSVTSSPNSGVPFTTSLGSSGCSWLNFGAGNGTTPANGIPVSLNTAVADGLSAGVYNCTITITSTNASNSPTVPVKLTLTAQSISVSPSSITFNYPVPVPNPGTAPITVSSAAGSLAVTASVGSGCNWLNLVSGNGTTPYSVSLGINTTVAATLASGSYTCAVTFTATGTTLTTTLQVTLVAAAPATLSASPSSLSFNYTQHGSAPAGTFLSVTSSPNSGVPFTTSLGSSGCTWLNFSAGNGTTPANSIPASVNTAVADGLSAGVYNCTITITSTNASNSPIAVPVKLTLTAQSISVSPSSITFNYPVPVPNPGTAPITVSSTSGSLPVTASLGSGCNWLNLVSGNGTTPYSVSLGINTTVAATLAGGTYTCTVTFTATSTTLTTTLQVILVVAPPASQNPSIQASVQACTVRGNVSGVSTPQNYRVVVYARTNMYYIQPCVTEPLTSVAASGTWGPIDSHNGDIFAILVRPGYSPPTVTTSLPTVDGTNVLAVTGLVGTLSGCDVARCPAQ